MEYSKTRHKFFGECAQYDSDNELEKQEAKQYLESWKKFLIRRLLGDSFSVKIIEEHWGEREVGCLRQMNNMYLKIMVEADWKYELK